jgi:uncharacterized glyoxalase superfamily protein PhnB
MMRGAGERLTQPLSPRCEVAMANVKPVPEGMHTLTPNLTIRDCARAIDFYRSALGADEIMRMPSPDGSQIWHAELRVGDSVFFANDAMDGMGEPPPSADRPCPVTLWLYVPDCDASHRRAVEAGAKSTMEPADMFWGDRVSSVTDPFGYRWSFATHVKDMTPEEMRQAGEEFARKMAAGGP